MFAFYVDEQGLAWQRPQTTSLFEAELMRKNNFQVLITLALLPVLVLVNTCYIDTGNDSIQ